MSLGEDSKYFICEGLSNCIYTAKIEHDYFE